MPVSSEKFYEFALQLWDDELSQLWKPEILVKLSKLSRIVYDFVSSIL